MKQVRTFALALLTVGLVATLAACGASTPGTNSSSAATTQSSGSSAAPSSASPSPNAQDISFVQEMIPHHQQAVVMADLALAQAASPAVKALATQIKAAQAPELLTMTGWLAAWGQPTSAPSSSDMAGMDHTGMDMGDSTSMGMMSDKELADLGAASGTAFDRMWLTMMIAHHQGAVSMADQEIAQGSNPDVIALAQSIMTGQTAEIATMKELLAAN